MNEISPLIATTLAALGLTVVIALALAALVVRGRAKRGGSGGGDVRTGRVSAEPARDGAPVAMGPGREDRVRLERRTGWPDDVAPTPLRDADRDRYQAAWRQVQALFVDDPRSGVLDADRLVSNVLRARGYRLPDSVTREAPGELEGPEIVERYWAGHDVVVRRQDANLQAGDLWSAMADYQAVLDALLEPDEAPAGEPPGAAGSGRPLSRSVS